LGFVKWKSHGIMKFKGLTVEGYDDSDD
jgi:hypothetical protein